MSDLIWRVFFFSSCLQGSGSSDESDEPTGKTTKTKEEEVTDWNKALEDL
jgi:hypothetical protein